jgi:hypothetical protein
VPGIEATDVAAREAALFGNVTSDGGLGNHVCAFLHFPVMLSWQDEWTETVGIKL